MATDRLINHSQGEDIKTALNTIATNIQTVGAVSLETLGMGFTTCSTEQATAAKTATLTGYTIADGGIVSVKFSNAVDAGATLNINSQGAKPIYYKGAAITNSIINAGAIATFVYNNNQYQLINLDTDVEQVQNNKNNISLLETKVNTTAAIISQTYNSADCNMSVYLYQDNGAIDNSTYYIADQSKMHFKIRQFRRLLRYWKDGVEYQKYHWTSMGLIATNNSAKKDMLTLDIPEVTNETYVKIQPITDDDDMQTNIGFVWQKSSVNVGDVWYIRPYIEYTDLETGMEYTMYGAVYKVTAGVPCTIECDTLSCTELTTREQANENNISITNILYQDMIIHSRGTIESNTKIWKQGNHIFGQIVINTGGHVYIGEPIVTLAPDFRPAYEQIWPCVCTDAGGTQPIAGYYKITNSSSPTPGGILVYSEISNYAKISIPIDFVIS